tara:strand:- start:7822 stop:8853 length:1032 start_codon:yes stop_codon:yes gene_type:complete
MSVTQFGTNNALTRKLWLAENEQLFRDAAKESYFLPRFGSEGNGSIIYEKKDLVKGGGDKLTFGIRMRLSGAGVGAGQTLEGNEESLTTHSYSVVMDRIRHGVRVENGLSKQRVQADMEKEAREGLKDWMAEKIDEKLFAALRATPTTVWYSNNGVPTKDTAANAKAAMNASEDKITPKLIRAVKTWAMTGGNRAQSPLRPIKINGKNHFVLVCHPDAVYDLKNDSTYTQYLREAEARGKENPIFSGAIAVIDNVIIHEHESAYIATDGGGASVPYAECFFMGAQALCWGWGMREEMTQESFDYGEQAGFGLGLNYAVGKTQFNSLDYGSVGVFVGRTQVSDA